MLDVVAFSRDIENLVEVTGLEYMDAVCHHCGDNNIEIEVGAELLSDKILASIEEEAVHHRLLKDNTKRGRLPI